MKKNLLKNFLLVSLLISCLVDETYAADPKLLPPKRVEFRTGYGYQYTNNTRPTHFQITPLLFSMVLPISESMGPSWFRGHFDWHPELTLGIFHHPYVRSLEGVTPLQFEYALECKNGWEPYLLVGTGILYAPINRRETESNLNFNIQGGVGVRCPLSGRLSLVAEYRHFHVSNGGIRNDNAGLNDNTFLLGLSLKH